MEERRRRQGCKRMFTCTLVSSPPPPPSSSFVANLGSCVWCCHQYTMKSQLSLTVRCFSSAVCWFLGSRRFGLFSDPLTAPRLLSAPNLLLIRLNLQLYVFSSGATRCFSVLISAMLVRFYPPRLSLGAQTTKTLQSTLPPWPTQRGQCATARGSVVPQVGGEAATFLPFYITSHPHKVQQPLQQHTNAPACVSNSCVPFSGGCCLPPCVLPVRGR